MDVFDRVKNHFDLRQNLNPTDVYSAFRVEHAAIEHTIYENMKYAAPCSSHRWAPTDQFYKFHIPATSIAMVTQRSASLRRAIRHFEYDQVTIYPTFQEDLVLNNEFKPISTMTHFTNLRKTVEALADARTDPLIWREYRETSSLPAAEWDDRHLLLNADDIMPANYTPDDLNNEIANYRDWLSAASEKIPKLFGGRDDNKQGSEAVLLSSETQNLKCREKNKEGRPVLGDVTHMWSQWELKEPSVFIWPDLDSRSGQIWLYTGLIWSDLGWPDLEF
ncbi:hypothetical protein LSTR_LSTR008110 [Laodelphax striatellus]|uniref:Uncharacterized protein n=1 Tax=Laodelphax striatellus TaxID=195883 RepID=A0A482XD27_LAOST|nr:hypothetical protein LSTR_LSTR008110 [Laodelphax striatellus]